MSVVQNDGLAASICASQGSENRTRLYNLYESWREYRGAESSFTQRCIISPHASDFKLLPHRRLNHAHPSSEASHLLRKRREVFKGEHLTQCLWCTSRPIKGLNLPTPYDNRAFLALRFPIKSHSTYSTYWRRGLLIFCRSRAWVLHCARDRQVGGRRQSEGFSAKEDWQRAALAVIDDERTSGTERQPQEYLNALHHTDEHESMTQRRTFVAPRAEEHGVKLAAGRKAFWEYPSQSTRMAVTKEGSRA
ncbi:hypothetical protein FB451DRAFT_1168516 [Mycena latifolia]|nr:hypothetical protein FB451DRAFT_1168516 [Mycena latifolia]